MASNIKNENENHVLKPLPLVIKNIVNKNHVLKPPPPPPPPTPQPLCSTRPVS